MSDSVAGGKLLQIVPIQHSSNWPVSERAVKKKMTLQTFTKFHTHTMLVHSVVGSRCSCHAYSFKHIPVRSLSFHNGNKGL